MKSIYTTALCAISMCAYAPAATVGMEDVFGPRPISDTDFNDIQINVSGVSFHLTGAFVFVPPPGYVETPFPNGEYFDYGVIDGPFSASFRSRESAYFDVAMVRVGSGPWEDIPTSGELTILAPLGSLVLFGARTPYATFYSDPALNADGLSHAAVHSPEPGTMLLIGCGLIAIARKRRRG